MATFPASPAPSQATSVAIKPRTNTIKFGDGYQLRATDGINTLPQQWSLQWNKIRESERVTLVNFLVARGGVENFDWATPNSGGTFKFICQDWSWVYGEYDLVDLRATFEQVFES